MEDMENKIGAILSNPELMEKIQALASSMGQSENTTASGPQNIDFDPSVLKKVAGLAGQSNIDKNEKALLSALRPYLTQQRISKLERAMRAAKMANMAGVFLGKTPTGR